MESPSQYYDRAKANFKIKTDSHIAREIGISRQYMFNFKNGDALLGEKAMVKLAEKAGLDVQEALMLRMLWAAKPETRPHYENILRELKNVFYHFVTLCFNMKFLA